MQKERFGAIYRPGNSNFMTLQLDNICAQRGDRLLFKSLSITLQKGQCLHLIGANGSGKTTLLRMIAGLRPTDYGSVLWCEMESNKQPEFHQQTAYLGHSDALKNELTAAENLQYWLQLDGVDASDVTVDQYLAEMGILAAADLTANKLSFGQRRRLAFARLLGKPAKLWILDEPFTGLDHEGRALVERLCSNHLSEHGSIVLTNHRSLRNSALAASLQELALDDFASQQGSEAC